MSSDVRTAFDTYASRYPHVKMERRDGILQMALHSDGGPFQYDLHSRNDVLAALSDVARDPDNRGYYGEFGGTYVPETLVAPVADLTSAYLEARADEGFRTELIITPASVYVGNKKIDLDVEGQLDRLRHHVDSRHETVKLTLRCSQACARTAAPAVSR